MWGRHKKIKEWVAAGVLTEPQAQAIESYEQTRKKGHFGNGLVNLSVFAIVIGVLSVIASNWYNIPGEVKIGAHVLLNAGVGAVALWALRKGKDVWREGATLAFIGLTMTLIILVGQVFQLDGSLTGALLLWMVITFPFFILMGRTYATAVPWMLAFLATLISLISDYVLLLPEKYQPYIYIGLPALLPLPFMGKGSLAWFKSWHPVLASVFLKTGVIISAVSASAALTLWGLMAYDLIHRNSEAYGRPESLIILAAGLGIIALHALLHGFYKNDERLKYGALYAVAGLVLTAVPFLLPQLGGPYFPALVFMAYWVFIGWTAQGMGHMRIVSLAIAIIAIRIFAIYVELFGTLLDTGMGLIVGGVVMLALIWGARKLNTRIKQKGVSHA